MAAALSISIATACRFDDGRRLCACLSEHAKPMLNARSHKSSACRIFIESRKLDPFTFTPGSLLCIYADILYIQLAPNGRIIS